MSCQSRPTIAFRGRQRGHDSPAVDSRKPHLGQWVASSCSSGWTVTSPEVRRSSSLPASLWNLARQGIRVPRDVDPGLVDIGLEEARADRALGAELLHSLDRQVIDQSGLGAIGHDGQVVARDDDPVPAQIACQRQVAGRGEQDGNAIELLVLQQLLHLAGNGFLDHRSECTLLAGRTVCRIYKRHAPLNDKNGALRRRRPDIAPFSRPPTAAVLLDPGRPLSLRRT